MLGLGLNLWRTLLGGASNPGGGGGDGETDEEDMTIIASGKISSPTSHFDVAIPTGYTRLRFDFEGIEFSAADQPAMQWSQDGGSTYLGDFDNSDTYTFLDIVGLMEDNQTGTQVLSTSTAIPKDDAICAIITGQPAIGVDFSAKMFPGNASQYPRFSFDSAVKHSANNVHRSSRQFTLVTLAHDATITPTLARVDKIRMASNNYFWGDQTVNFTAGVWFLRGIADPT